MAFAEDLSDFINDDTPGYATATLDGGEAFGGIYDNGSANALGGMVMGTKPTLTCAVADVGESVRGKMLVVTYQSVVTSYKVAGGLPDGTGMTVLELDEQ